MKESETIWKLASGQEEGLLPLELVVCVECSALLLNDHLEA